MARRKKAISPQEPLAVVIERMQALEERVRILSGAQMSSVQTARHDTFLSPAQGMVMIDWPSVSFCFYHNNEWICIPLPATHAIKVYNDKKVNSVLDGAFKFDVERDLDGYQLWWAGAFNGTPGTGTTTVHFTNKDRGDLHLLNTALSIPSGQTNSFATEPDINDGGLVTNPNHRVHEGDTIWVDVKTVGAGSKGLGVYMTFARRADEI